VLIIGVVSPFISIWVGQQSAERTIRQSEAVQAETAKQSHDLVCYLFGAILDAYSETPPTAPAGRNVRDAWAHLYTLAQCQPPRKE
jgi:hypothetical protein